MTLAETTDDDPYLGSATRTDRFEYLLDGRPLQRSVSTSLEPETYTLVFVYEEDLLRELVDEVDGVERSRVIEVDLAARRATLRELVRGALIGIERIEWNRDGTVALMVRERPGLPDHCESAELSYDEDGFLLRQRNTSCAGDGPVLRYGWTYRWEALPDRERLTVLGSVEGLFSRRVDWMSGLGTVRGSATRVGVFDDDAYDHYTGGCRSTPVRPRVTIFALFDIAPFRLAGAPLVEDPPLVPTPGISPFIRRSS